jgi:O-antigen/teichoic acid export membrane protein
MGFSRTAGRAIRNPSAATRNAVSSLVSLVWLNLLSILAIPAYVKLLGTGSWGIAAACNSLQLVFTLIDLGFSQIVPRWVAREAQTPALLARYIRVFQKIYGVLALGGFTLIEAAAYPLAHHWFNVAADEADELVLCIRLIAFQLLFQFVNNLYVGVWHGLQLQVQANFRTCVFGTLKHALAIGTLLWVGRSPVLYASAFAAVALIELSFSVIVTRRLGLLAPPQGPPADIRAFVREAAVLSFGVLVGLAVSQLDRVILSRLVTVETFGIYVVVINLALAFLALQTPLTRAYFPVLVRDVKETGRADPATLRRLLVGNTLLCVVPALGVCVFADRVIALWVHNPNFVKQGTLPLRLLLVAMCFNVVYNCFYQVIVAQGSAHVVVKLNLACLAVGVIVAAAFASHATLALGGFIWLATTFTQLVLGIGWYWIDARRAPIARPL